MNNVTALDLESARTVERRKPEEHPEIRRHPLRPLRPGELELLLLHPSSSEAITLSAQYPKEIGPVLDWAFRFPPLELPSEEPSFWTDIPYVNSEDAKSHS